MSNLQLADLDMYTCPHTKPRMTYGTEKDDPTPGRGDDGPLGIASIGCSFSFESAGSHSPRTADPAFSLGPGAVTTYESAPAYLRGAIQGNDSGLPRKPL